MVVPRSAPVTSHVSCDVPPADFEALYQARWWPMVRLATGLVGEVGVAEEVVQDAFTALYRRWDRLADPGAAEGYLRVSVVNAARSVLRRRSVARRLAPVHAVRDTPVEGADHAALASAEHDRLRRALAGLPQRQREVLTLRYLLDLGDPEIAAATGLSAGGVRSASSRGLAALRTILGGAS